MKVRIISALITLAIILPIVILGGPVFAGACGIISILAYKELLDLKKSHKKIPKIVTFLGLVSIIYLILNNYNGLMINYRSLAIPFLLICTPTIFYKKEHYTTDSAMYLLGITWLISLFFKLLIIIRDIDVYLLVYLALITVFTDTFAYIIGCLIGKHKICPTVSPLKSWEGAIAGLIGGSTVAIIFYIYFLGSFSIKLLICTMILSAVGQLGDLFFSKIKRENGIKDFSNLIPGHGGILDRFDSIIFVVFTYAVLIWTL